VSDVDTYRLCGSDADVVLDTDGEWVAVEDYDRLTAELVEARSERDALRKDAERLDWIENELMNHGTVQFISLARKRGIPCQCEMFSVSTQHLKANSVRKAIDAAICWGN